LSRSDRIPAELTQAGGNILHYESHKLINSFWNKEELPQQWKGSIIVPIYKNGEKPDYSNYRGISMLPSMYKILHNIVSRLTSYVEETTGEHQSGF